MKPLESKKFGSFTVEIHSDSDCENPLELDDNVYIVEYGYRSELSTSKEHYHSEDDFLIALAQKIHPDFPDHVGSIQAEKIVKKHFVMSGDVNQRGRNHAFVVALISDLMKDGIKDPQSFIDGCAESYSTWSNGECVGFITKDENDEEIDSCWGFYSSEDAYQAAQENFPTRNDQYYFDLYENQ
jgi:hypothetical protein